MRNNFYQHHFYGQSTNLIHRNMFWVNVICEFIKMKNNFYQHHFYGQSTNLIHRNMFWVNVICEKKWIW